MRESPKTIELGATRLCSVCKKGISQRLFLTLQQRKLFDDDITLTTSASIHTPLIFQALFHVFFPSLDFSLLSSHFRPIFDNESQNFFVCKGSKVTSKEKKFQRLLKKFMHVTIERRHKVKLPFSKLSRKGPF